MAKDNISTDNKTDVIFVGASVAGLAAAITLKTFKPELDVCVIDKANKAGNHCLSGAAVEKKQIENLLSIVDDKYRDSDIEKELFSRTVNKEEVHLLIGKKIKIPMTGFIKLCKMLNLPPGEMVHKGDYLLSISRLTKYLTSVAEKTGVEVIFGLSVEDICWQDSSAVGIILKEQGLDRDGNKTDSYIAAETVYADVIVLAEGCDGLVSEKFIEKAGLKRACNQVYSLGIKEVIKVSHQQYENFGKASSIHFMGYPLWTAVAGPGIFGGGFMYSMGDNKIAVGIVAALDFKYCDFDPQEALALFKETDFAKKYLSSGQVIEAGAKMIPEGGFFAIPRTADKQTIGKDNVIIIGDSAGFVNMQKIKGIHNAIESGVIAADAISENIDTPENIALNYTNKIDSSNIYKELFKARNFRQCFAKLGPLLGMTASIFSSLLPEWKLPLDYTRTTQKKYRYKTATKFDKASFTALSKTSHRENQSCHLIIKNPDICLKKCKPLGYPCTVFCPAGVYEQINSSVKAANPSNCLHCKTCQRKCPFDNIRWTVPEGSDGPGYKGM